jgi:hypothetical protein
MRDIHRILRATERDEERITLRLNLVPAMCGECLAQNPPVLVKRIAVPVAQLFQQPRRALDVSEQEGDGPDREFVRIAQDPSVTT